MFCTRCGSTTPDDAAFCPNCGQALKPGYEVAPGGEAVYRFLFHGQGGELFVIYLWNLLLSVITLGIYSFWGRTKIRRFMYGNTEFAGERLTYHGTGGELLRGFLKVIGVLALLYIQMGIWALLGGQTGQVIGGLVMYIGLFAAMPLAMVGSWRYRLSRTSYRGVRFSFRGDLGEAYRIYVGGTLLTIVTAGFYGAHFANNLRRYQARNTWYGNVQFDYDGEGADLFGPWCLNLLLMFPTLGCIRFWYMAKAQRYYWSRTSLLGARFRSLVTGMSVFEIIFTNLLLVVFTLGVGAAWARVRMARFVASNLQLGAAIDLAAVQQQAVAATAEGDVLADVFNTGGFDAGIEL